MKQFISHITELLTFKSSIFIATASVLIVTVFATAATAQSSESCWLPNGEIQQDLTPLEKAVCGVGGLAVLDNSFTIEAAGARFIFGESFDAHDAPQPNAQFTSTTSIQKEYIRVDWNTTIFPDTPITRNITYSEIIRGNLGYIVGVDNWLVTPTTNMPSGRVASIRKQVLLTNPHLYLAMAEANPSIVSESQPPQVVEGDEVYDVLTIDDGVSPPVDLYVDSTTGHISKLATMENDHLFRDVPLVVTYRDWTNEAADSDLLSFPMNITLTGRGDIWYEEHRAKITQNPTFTSEFDFPAEANPVYEEEQFSWGRSTSQFIQMWCTFGVSKNEQQLAVVPTELVAGVYVIQGAMYNSMVVDQGKSVVVIEAPLYPERSEAILAWIAATLNKPVSHLVVTHHHFDHTGGVRAFVAAGVPIMVGEPAVGFLQEVAQTVSSVVPDAQQDAHAQPIFVPIELNNLGVIENGTAVVQPDSSAPTGSLGAERSNVVYAFRFATSHANDLMLVKIATGAEGPTVLFQSDLFNPDDKTGRALNPIWAVEFANGLNAAGLNVPDTILVGGHAGYAPLSQLYEFVDSQVSISIKGYVFFQAYKQTIIIVGVLSLLAVLFLIGWSVRSKANA